MCVTENCVICLNPAKFKRLNGASRALAIQKIKNKDGIQKMGERLKCGHIYHRKCILSWFLNLDSENSYNCPLCRGEIQFSNNMGMMNWMLFDRKYRLEYAKAYAEGYREEDYDEEDEGEEDYDQDEDEEDYDEEDEDEDSGSESSWENYDDVLPVHCQIRAGCNLLSYTTKIINLRIPTTSLRFCALNNTVLPNKIKKKIKLTFFYQI